MSFLQWVTLFIKWRLVPDNTVKLIHNPSLVWHTRQLNPGYCHCYLLYLPISISLFSILLYRWTHGRIKARGYRHHIQWPAAPETAARAWPLPLIDKGGYPKRTAVDPTVASTRLFLLFPSFFSSTSMPITSSRPTSQVAGCLTAPSLPHHRPPRPPVPVIGTINIRGGRGYGLAHAIWAVEHGGFDIMETIQTDTCCNNRQGYGTRGAAARPSRAGVSQDGMRVGSQDRLNGWGASPRAYTGRTWWAARSCRRCQRWIQGEGWQQWRMRCWWWCWFWGWKW